jgi:hypothetical protein
MEKIVEILYKYVEEDINSRFDLPLELNWNWREYIRTFLKNIPILQWDTHKLDEFENIFGYIVGVREIPNESWRFVFDLCVEHKDVGNFSMNILTISPLRHIKEKMFDEETAFHLYQTIRFVGKLDSGLGILTWSYLLKYYTCVCEHLCLHVDILQEFLDTLKQEIIFHESGKHIYFYLFVTNKQFCNGVFPLWTFLLTETGQLVDEFTFIQEVKNMNKNLIKSAKKH